MNQNYSKEDRVLLAVDCIIFGFDQEELKILLIKRFFEPEKGKWSLMGGFLRKDETLKIAANRILYELTGIEYLYMEQLFAFSEIERDPGERTISVAYFALINIDDYHQSLIKKYSAKWFSISDYPELIFDHSEMINKAIKRLRYKTSKQPIGFELLPTNFTMRQLQKLYEAILGRELDKRNFVNKVKSLDILKRLKEKDMVSSKKGSYLYAFDAEKYNQKVDNGFIFKI